MTPKSPAFQFYPHDFLAGRVATYSMEEVGCYITLLSFDWTLGGLPTDADCEAGIGQTSAKLSRNLVQTFAKLCRTSSRSFARIWTVIGDQFVMCEDRKLRNPRLQAERMKQLAYSESMSENGKLGGRPKKPQVSHGLAAAKPDESTPSPTPSTSKEQLLGEDVRSVLEHFTATHPRRKVGKKDPSVVRAALALGYSPAELRQAIDGNANDGWHVSNHKHELSYVLRNTGLIDGFIAKAVPIDDDEPITDRWGCLTSYGDKLTQPSMWQ